MSSCKHRITSWFIVASIAAAILAIGFTSVLDGFAQVTNWGLPRTQLTNSIPTNLFLTDEAMLVRFKNSGEMVVDTKKIKEAENLPECRPAAQDPEGHWGEPTNGFQLSLRFNKYQYTVGEAVMATTLMRNITNSPQTYFSPINIIARKDGHILKRKHDDGLKRITMLPDRTILPQIQEKASVNLLDYYDLSEGGEYVFQAECKEPRVFSRPVDISITNAASGGTATTK